MRRFFFLCSFALLAISGPAFTQDKFEIRGLVKEMDAKVGTITIAISKSGSQTYSLKSANLPVRDAKDNPLKLEIIRPGRKVALTVMSETEVVSIQTFPSFVVGKVVSANPETRELEVMVKKEKQVFKIGKDAHYWRSERIVAPRDLRPGEQIKVYYLPEKSNEVTTILYRALDSQ